MRIPLPALVFAAAAGLVLSGCTTSTVVEGSEVAVAVSQLFTSLNPATSYGRTSVTNGDVAYLTGTGFAYYDDSYRIVEDRSFGTAEVIAEDPLTVRYTVAADARWSDGTPVDAADLLLAWVANSGALNTPDFDDSEWVDPATGRYREDFPTDVVFFDGAIGGGLEKATQAPEISEDGRSITVRFEEFVSNWRLALAPGLPAHVVAVRALDLPEAGDTDEAGEGGEAAESDEADRAKQALVAAVLDNDSDDLAAIARFWNDAYNVAETPADKGLLVAAGPYVVSSIAADAIVLEANGLYRGDRRPAYETIRIRISPDPLETVSLLASHEVDIVSPEPSQEVVDALLAVDGVSVVAGSEGRFEHLDLQFADGRSTAFTDQRVREAFLSVVPRQQILENLVLPVQEEAVLLDSFVVRPGAEGYAETIAANGSRRYSDTDVDRATALLAEAGEPDPEVCILYDPSNPRRVTQFALIRDSAARAGFRVTDCSNPDWEGLLGVAGAYDAALFAWDTTRLGPAAVGAVFHSDSELANFNRYSNPEVDALVEELDATDDEARQAKLLAEIDALLWADAYGLPLFAYPTVTAVRETVAGVSRSPLARTVFWNAWEWHPAESD